MRTEPEEAPRKPVLMPFDQLRGTWVSGAGKDPAALIDSHLAVRIVAGM